MRFLEAIKVFLLAALVGGIVAVCGFLLLDRLQPGQMTIGPGEERHIMVSIVGAVHEPGTHELLAGARLGDLVAEAGGFTEQADTTSLNMAGRLADGELVTIPLQGAPAATTESATPGAESAPVATALININTATTGELTQLPGIGPALAKRIVAFREFYGPFTSVDQLAEVSGISAAMVDDFRHLVTTGG